MADADGANTRQLTFDGRFHNEPTVCEGGQSVVYDSDSAGVSHLWMLDLKSGTSRQLTAGLGEANPRCGLTGDWVYYNGDTRQGPGRVFKITAIGGVPVQVSDQITYYGARPSPDEKHVVGFHPGKEREYVASVLSTTTGVIESEYTLPPTTDDLEWMPDSRSYVAIPYGLWRFGASPPARLRFVTYASALVSLALVILRW